MKKRILIPAIALIMMLASGMTVFAAPENAVFNAAYYAAANPDVADKVGTNPDALYNHFIRYGLAAGLAASPDFDVRAYRARYPDLDAAFGDNWLAYAQHYMAAGIKEGRNGAPDNAAAQNVPDNSDNNANVPDDGYKGQIMDAMAREAFDAINRYRAQNGKSALVWSDSIYEAVKLRAKECSTVFEHTRPDGTSCFTALDEMGIGYSTTGENIAAGYHSGEAVAEGWYHSEGHRRNMLNDGFKNAAVACYYDPAAGGYSYYWVNLFTG